MRTGRSDRTVLFLGAASALLVPAVIGFALAHTNGPGPNDGRAPTVPGEAVLLEAVQRAAPTAGATQVRPATPGSLVPAPGVLGLHEVLREGQTLFWLVTTTGHPCGACGGDTDQAVPAGILVDAMDGSVRQVFSLSGSVSEVEVDTATVMASLEPLLAAAPPSGAGG